MEPERGTTASLLQRTGELGPGLCVQVQTAAPSRGAGLRQHEFHWESMRLVEPEDRCDRSMP